MTRKLLSTIFALFVIAALACPAIATTYYIATNGSDSNNGTSKTTPWAHIPGMATWTGKYVPLAGDTLILRGCDTWGNSNFPINWTWSGTSASPITIDRDTTWYNTASCPSSWNRAIFDAQNTAMSTNIFVKFQGATHVNFKWIEAKDLFWNNASPSGGLATAWFGSSDYVTLQYWYIHHWTHGSSAGDTDNMVMFLASSSSGYGCEHCKLDYSIVDNTDGDGADCNGADATCSGGGINIPTTHSVLAGMTNVFKVFTGGEWAYNDISQVNQDFTHTYHPNMFESIGAGIFGTSGVFYYHDNYTHNTSNGEGFQVGNPNETDYAWNNVWDMTPNRAGNNGPQVPQQGGTSNWSLYFWNNTVIWGTGCIVEDSGSHGTAVDNYYFQNNHCINDGKITNNTVAGALAPSGAHANSNNLGMTTSTATSQGYTSGETFVYSPSTGTDSTVGAGADLSASWPSGFSTADTTYACSKQTVSGVIQPVCPARAANARASSWDIGAYQFAAGGATPPNPPTALSYSIQ